MKKRAAVHSFDVALGLVWLTIIFTGLLFLLTRDAAPVTQTDPTLAPEFSDRMRVLESLSGGNGASVSEAEKLQLVSALQKTSIADDRASVQDEDQLSQEQKLQVLESLRVAR